MLGILSFDLHITGGAYEIRLADEMVTRSTMAALHHASRNSLSPMMYLMEFLAERYPDADGRSLTLVPS